MKKLFLLITMTLMVGMISSPVFAQKKGNNVVCFKSDMDCAQCETSLKEYLKFEKGVKDLKVDHGSNTILIEYKDGKNSEQGLTEAIEKKGYKAEKITTEEYAEILEHAHDAGHEHAAEVHKERK